MGLGGGKGRSHLLLIGSIRKTSVEITFICVSRSTPGAVPVPDTIALERNWGSRARLGTLVRHRPPCPAVPRLCEVPPPRQSRSGQSVAAPRGCTFPAAPPHPGTGPFPAGKERCP